MITKIFKIWDEREKKYRRAQCKSHKLKSWNLHELIKIQKILKQSAEGKRTTVKQIQWWIFSREPTIYLNKFFRPLSCKHNFLIEGLARFWIKGSFKVTCFSEVQKSEIFSQCIISSSTLGERPDALDAKTNAAHRSSRSKSWSIYLAWVQSKM